MISFSQHIAPDGAACSALKFHLVGNLSSIGSSASVDTMLGHSSLTMANIGMKFVLLTLQFDIVGIQEGS